MPKTSRSSTITEPGSASAGFGPAIHPGEILREDYLVPLRLTPYALAKRLRVPRTRIERLAAGRTSVTADTALRLARFFGTTPQFWMNMQASHDLAVAAAATKEELEAIRALEQAA
ncbi:HigA family addiction module antitoxin [Propylenella binzhouense]|uniref:Addiction module antidote protein, HigA family n=1 Tax=Propylenella binzhouense TaxID=2555902 RepID=A0A964WUN8_9HYPH|nr:HigA family addiction module antitoxin [Propylenella binzhouense]MYZ49218.1 addiction module antidote protein, HigA family [Propylenella binzhouense]